MENFTVFPAIDLRRGKVVRLRQGDPTRQTTYADEPLAVARRWLEAGAEWLHIVNLDGAFGEESAENLAALQGLVNTGAKLQFGGGLRSLASVEQALAIGVRRAILGTVAVLKPEIVSKAMARFGADHVIVGIDEHKGDVRVHGWSERGGISSINLGKRLRDEGVKTVIFTDVNRDGMEYGLNLAATVRLAEETGLDVIASGGVASLEDIRRARQTELLGVVVGRALYEGRLTLEEALQC
jgi:phosphoribosylformimino-5-aminoimidazole carboxamide ribotide isomerase